MGIGLNLVNYSNLCDQIFCSAHGCLRTPAFASHGVSFRTIERRDFIAMPQVYHNSLQGRV